MRYVSHWPSLTPLLFLAVYLPTGTPRAGGFRKLSAYTRAKVRGTRTPATAITAGCSFCGLRGDQWAAMCDLIPPVLVSSCTGPGWCTGGTATPGTNGGQRERAD